MKGRAVGLTLASLLLVALLAPPAEARPHRHHHRFRAGVATGLLFSPLVVPGSYCALPYYRSPYYPPPPADPPACPHVDTPGHWAIIPVEDGHGFTAYYSQWVPDLHETVCP